MIFSKLIQVCHLVATRDLAILYGVETKKINEAVWNNPNKFLARFLLGLDEGISNFFDRKFRQKWKHMTGVKNLNRIMNCAIIGM